MFTATSYLITNNLGSGLNICVHEKNFIRCGCALDIIAALTMIICAWAAAEGCLSINTTAAAIIGTIGLAYFIGVLKLASDLKIIRLSCIKNLCCKNVSNSYAMLRAENRLPANE